MMQTNDSNQVTTPATIVIVQELIVEGRRDWKQGHVIHTMHYVQSGFFFDLKCVSLCHFPVYTITHLYHYIAKPVVVVCMLTKYHVIVRKRRRL